MSRFSLCSFSTRIKVRWRDSWLTDRIELNGGLLGACRHERVRPKIAALALVGLLLGQTIVPGAMLLGEVRAGELRQGEALKQQKQEREAQTPAWAKAVEARAAREKRENALRLVQAPGADRVGNLVNRPPLVVVPGSKPGQIPASAELDCPDCEVDVRSLDLTRVPTETELRRAGQLGGALNPTRPADAGELGFKLDKLVKLAGVENGLKAELPKKDPRERGLAKAKEKYERAREVNLDFGKAIQKWNEHTITARRRSCSRSTSRIIPKAPGRARSCCIWGATPNTTGALPRRRAFIRRSCKRPATSPTPSSKRRARNARRAAAARMKARSTARSSRPRRALIRSRPP